MIALGDVMEGLLSLLLFAAFFGLVVSYGYGWYFALIWAPLYNLFSARQKS